MIASFPVSLRHCVALTRSVARQVRRNASAFRADRSGNVAIIFAVALIPVFGGVGVAVDYSRANNARTELQAALDVTALMISREALDIKSGQVQKRARTYFKAQFDRPDIKGVNPTFALQNNGPGDFTVVAEAAGYIDTTIAQVLGKKAIDLRVTSQVLQVARACARARQHRLDGRQEQDGRAQGGGEAAVLDPEEELQGA